MIIIASEKVAGEIASLDAWRKCIAVGSTEAQLFHWQRDKLHRTLLCREEDPVKVVACTHNV